MFSMVKLPLFGLWFGAAAAPKSRGVVFASAKPAHGNMSSDVFPATSVTVAV